EFASYGAENTRAARVLLRVNEHQGIAIKAYITAVIAPRGLLATYDHAAHHIARLDVPAGHGFLDAGDNHITQAGVAPTRAAQYLNAHTFLGAGVIRVIEVCVHLNHDQPSFPTTRTSTL